MKLTFLSLFLFIGCSSNQCVPMTPGQTIIQVHQVNDDCISYTELHGHMSCRIRKTIDEDK